MMFHMLMRTHPEIPFYHVLALMRQLVAAGGGV